MKPHPTNILFISIILMCIFLSVSTQETPKLVKIQFEQILSNPKIQPSKLITLNDFVQRIKDDPASLLELKDLYVIDWPVPKVQTPPPAAKTQLPPQPQPQTTATSTTQIQQIISTQIPTPTFTVNAPPKATTTTITTKTQQNGNQPAQTTTTKTTTTSNQQLLNPSQDALNNVLSKFNIPNNPFGNILDAFKNIDNIGGSSSSASASINNFNQPDTNIQKTNTQTTVTNKNTNNGKTVSTTTVTTNQNIQPPPASTKNPTSTTASTPAAGSSLLPESITTMRQQMRALTNNLRANHGAGSVSMNSLLTKIAQDHSNDMVARNFFAHQNPDGERSSDRAVRNGYKGMIGQNLAQAFSINQAQIGFQNSPTHFTNAINPQWQQIGVGIAKKGSFLFITVLFTPRNIAKTQLSPSQLQRYKSLIGDVIKQQNPTIKTVDNDLSSYIQEWMDGNRGSQMMQHVVNRGGYRTPMTASTYTVDYSNDFVDRVRKNKYFLNGNPIFKKFGIGVKQKDMKLEINVIYM